MKMYMCQNVGLPMHTKDTERQNETMNEIIKELSLIGVLPVLKIDREEDAVPV